MKRMWALAAVRALPKLRPQCVKHMPWVQAGCGLQGSQAANLGVRLHTPPLPAAQAGTCTHSARGGRQVAELKGHGGWQSGRAAPVRPAQQPAVWRESTASKALVWAHGRGGAEACWAWGEVAGRARHTANAMCPPPPAWITLRWLKGQVMEAGTTGHNVLSLWEPHKFSAHRSLCVAFHPAACTQDPRPTVHKLICWPHPTCEGSSSSMIPTAAPLTPCVPQRPCSPAAACNSG